MGFSSIPAYLDPSNWHQQQSHQIIGSSGTNPLLPPPPTPQPHGAGIPGSIRPGSMAEQARMANVPMPETSLKCPRCESSNTKFCYFNNYSLKQPRHFCKTCRRYWTRGGALRNVPVGGGCRRNKRSKLSSSKSPANRGNGQTTSSSTNSMSTNSGSAILGLTPPQLTPLRFMSPLSQLTDSFTNDLAFNYSGISAPMVGSSEMNFHNNLLSGGEVANFLSGGGGSIEPWRLQQFPFLGGLESNLNGVYQYKGRESGLLGGGDVRQPNFSASMLSQLASVKMEDNAMAELNLSRQALGGGVSLGNNNDHQWNNNNHSGGGGAPNWTHLSSFSSSSTSNPL